MTDFMKEAIKEAKKALLYDEVPIGAVIVCDGKIISRAFNQREKKPNALAHAEVVAINKACKKLGSWRLDNATIYVTLEPCPMCAGAITNARIKEVVYGCEEETSKDKLCQKIFESDRLNHHPAYTFDQTHKQEISQLLQQFFKEKRQKQGKK